MEPMDTDEAQQITNQLARRIQDNRGLQQSGSLGTLPTSGPMMLQSFTPMRIPEGCDAWKDEGSGTRWDSKGEETIWAPETIECQALEHLRRTQEGPSLVDIPPCSTWEPPEIGVPSLHRPEMVGPTDEYPQATGQGARPKTRPQYSTKMVAEEMVIIDE